MAAAARIDPLVERLRRLGYRCVCVPGYGADAVIATLVTAYKERCSDIRIASDNEKLEMLVGDGVRIDMPDPPTPDAFLERQERRRSEYCQRDQLPDWSVLDRALGRLFRASSDRHREIRRILRRCGSLPELFEAWQADTSHVADFFAERPEVLAHLIEIRSDMVYDRNTWALAIDVAVDSMAALEKPDPQLVHPDEAALLAGERWRPPEPPRTYEERPLDAFPELETRVREHRRGRDVQVLVEALTLDRKPAIFVDRGIADQPDLFRAPSPGSIVRLFSSAEDRDEHLEQLWRYGEV